MKLLKRNGWNAVFIALLFVPTFETVAHELTHESAPDSITKATHESVAAERADYDLFQGDILVDTTSAFSLSTRGMARINKSDRWPFGQVYYEFDDTLPEEDLAMLGEAIAHWNNNTSITLSERTDNTITDYIRFMPEEGCASWVGRIGGAQDLWVGPTCHVGSMIHEIGHAIGLYHEHTRADRDNFIVVEWENIREGKAQNFDIIDDGIELIGDYDYGSIMHYGTHYFSADGLPTMTVPDGITIGQRDALSPGDIAAIDYMYQTDLALVVDTSVDAGITTLTVDVTNNGTLGAHAIEYVLPVSIEADSVVADDPAWQCEVEAAALVCRLDQLDIAETRRFSISVDTPGAGIDTQLSWLQAKTHDPDLSNNGAVPPPEDSVNADKESDSPSPSPGVNTASETESQPPADTENTGSTPATTGTPEPVVSAPATPESAPAEETILGAAPAVEPAVAAAQPAQTEDTPAVTGAASVLWWFVVLLIYRRRLDS